MATCSRIFMRNISGVVIFFIVVLFGTGTLMSFAQDNPSGFISIDCGSIAPPPDPQTNLPWVEDGEYVKTGKNGLVPEPDLVNSTLDNYQALLSFRYFSEKDMRSKYCYELPMTTTNISFLLRAMFLHGNASELSLPTEFGVYVNATLWITVTYSERDDLLHRKVHESIFFSPPGGNITNVCLVPKQGVPFMSSLELRQFDPEGVMYTKSFLDHRELLFTNSVRWNIGATNSTTIRYPDDPYDRLWNSYPRHLNYVEYIQSLGTLSKIGPEVNSVPSKVMEDACFYYVGPNPGPDDGIVLRLDLPYTEPGSFTYGIFYFARLNESTSLRDIPNITSITMALDTTQYLPFDITSQPSEQSFFHVLNTNYSAVTFYGNSIFNALEFYAADSFIRQTTYEDQVYVMDFIKKILNMTNWQGDPCAPVPYNWIGCELEYKGSDWFVTNLTLSHLQNSSRLIELNSLGGFFPVKPLLYLSITNSNIRFALFQSLLQNFVNASQLLSLNMSFNDISTLPDAQWWINVANSSEYSLSSLDLSYNQLSRIPSFAEIPFSNRTEILNLSNNKIMGDFPNIVHFSNLRHLQILNVSDNYIQGKIPSSLSSQHLPSLQALDISTNNFSGAFPSEFYFVDNGSPFEYLNAGNNEISGVLNLTIWYQNLKAIYEVNVTFKSTRSEGSPRINRVFSFLNNKISGIQPSIEDFQPMIESLISLKDFNQSGILLGGNPFCKNAKHFTQRYLCRSSFTEIVNGDVKEKTREAIILGSVFGGGFLLLCFGFLTFVILRLSKKVYILKMVEQELANRRVQPPYYSYYDLKLATKNFHKDSCLGKGGFGAVYKGALPDGTTIAVKRLFNSKQKQVLNEFLNEVVLITGIKHKNLIQLKGCCIENQERILVYGYAENGNLHDALWDKDAKKKLTWKNRFKICVGVASGLTYLHEELQPRIIHRDIKPANVLLDKNLIPKIADFGLAKGFVEEIDEHVTQVISGTRGYFAPEYLSEGRLTTKVDVFSFGIVALEIVSGRKCFDLSLPSEEIHLTSWAQKLQKSGSTLTLKLLDPAIQSEYSEAEVLKVINIALMCIQSDPKLRPAMSEVETMLLEGHERVYDILWTAVLKKGEDNSSLDNISEGCEGGMEVDTVVPTPPWGHGHAYGYRSEASGIIGTSSSHGQMQSEEYPFLYGQSNINVVSIGSDVEISGSGNFPLGTLRRSFSASAAR